MLKYYYTYYSYEEWGRGYIGSRECKCLPEEDVKYFGSYRNKTFKPTQKIILGTYDTREEALTTEIILHEFYDVANNPHFANRAKQTSTKFYYVRPTEEAREIARKVGIENRKLKRGVCGRSKEKMIEDSRKGGLIAGKIVKNEGKGIFALTEEQRKENARKGGLIVGPKVGKENVELQRGFFAMSKEERIEVSRKAGQKNKELGLGFFGLTKEERREINNRRWQCTITGHISTASGLTKYQRKRNIDTSNRIRIS